MSSRLEKARQEAESKIAGLGEGTNQFQKFVSKTLLGEYARDFISLLQSNIKSRGVVGSGQLEKNIEFELDDQGKKLTITMLDYFDYPNEGVKGVKFSKNAQGSPYQFKNYGMNAEGRASIKEYIQSGRAKISDTYKAKRPKGLEGKRKSLLDTQTDQLIYLIKKHGIKRTDYFNDAFNVVFSAFAEEMAKAYGQDVALNIKLISKNK